MQKSVRRYRHPCDTELRRYSPLSYMILDAVRYALYTPAHPDSTRQRKARRRACELRQARMFKGTRRTWVPALPVVWEPRPDTSLYSSY